MNHHKNTMNTNPDNRQFSPVDHLTQIIREVDRGLFPHELAEAILDHPRSAWHPSDNLAQPEGEGPSIDDIQKLCMDVELLMFVDSSEFDTVVVAILEIVRAALTRWGRPVVSPIAVSERLPGERDCAPWDDDPNATPWCWAARKGDDGWEWAQISMLGLSIETLDLVISGGGWTHWAPHWAFPVPQATLSTIAETP